MKTNQIGYIKAQSNNATTIEIDNVIDFYKYCEQHHVKIIFVLNNGKTFGILANQFIIQTPTNGYETIEDAKMGIQNKFPSALDFYTAKSEGITNYDLYEIKIKHGIEDLEILNKLQDEGYIEGFENYKNINELHQLENPELAKFLNAQEFYNYAQENGYISPDELIKSLQGGFHKAHEFNIALNTGFENKAEYKEALENGFASYELYKKAKEEKVKTYLEFIEKQNLELYSPDLPHDQSLLLLLLSKLEQGKKIGINKLKLLLEKTLNQYKTEDKKLFDWFKTSLKKNKDYIIFLETNTAVTQFGHYDSDGEFLEIFQLQNRSIVIDGSNVAHNSQNAQPEKPSITNLIKMVRFLKTKGFSDILIIADASLRHKLIDLDKLAQLNEEAKYLIAPAGTAADIYLIEHVKRKHCLLLSNDAFKQYKITDPWVALNIDYYRLTFMITEEGVFMPDIK